ncbi:MAG: trypsin-like peptidase domain-containing protein [Thermoflexaceae bacterium]|nr:trypsin-like peptidase domain-containing protein [Thermoflexaceae bacterium]
MFENDENDEYNYNGIIGNSESHATDGESENSVDSEEEKKDAYAGYTTPQEPYREEKTEVCEEPKEKKKGFWGAVKFVGMAAAFGIVAGGAFFAVNYTASMATGTKTEAVEETTKETAGIVVNKTSTSDTKGAVMVMDVSEVIDNAMPSAVSITGTVTTTYQLNPFFGNAYETETPISGSGVIIGQNGTELLIVTNAHVVEDVNGIEVTFINGSKADAVVKGAKSDYDIAVIAVSLNDLSADTLSSISIVEIGDSESLRMGQPVIAIGNALGEGQSSTVGWISALNRTITIEGKEYENMIMTDAAINPGNSGGALLNTQGQLVGINSAKYSDEKVEGMGYAIPISYVADIINELMNRQVRTKVDEDSIGYLGVTGMDISKSISQAYGWPEGLLITSIGENSPAANAGLLKNDILVEFDGEDISSLEQLRSLLEYYQAGEIISVSYYRLENGEYALKSTDVTLGSRSANQ